MNNRYYRKKEKLSDAEITKKIDEISNEFNKINFSELTTCIAKFYDISNINSNDKSRIRIFLNDYQGFFKDEDIARIIEFYFSLIDYSIIDYSINDISKLLNYMINKGGLDCFRGICSLLFREYLNDLNDNDKNNLIQFLKGKSILLYEIKDDDDNKIPTFLELIKKIGINYDFRNELQELTKNLIDIDDFKQIYSLCRLGYLDEIDDNYKEELSRYVEKKLKTYKPKDMEGLLNVYFMILDKNLDIDLTDLLTNFINQLKNKKIEYSSKRLLRDILQLLLTKEFKTKLDFETISTLLGVSFDSTDSLNLIPLYNNKYKKNKFEYLLSINDIDEYISFLRQLFFTSELSTFREETAVILPIFHKLVFMGSSTYIKYLKLTYFGDDYLYEEDFKRLFDFSISLVKKECCKEKTNFFDKKCLCITLYNQQLLRNICYTIENILKIITDKNYEIIITFIKEIIGLCTDDEKMPYFLSDLFENNKEKLKIDSAEQFYEECLKYRNEFLDSPMPGHEEMSIRAYNDKIYGESQKVKTLK